MFRANVASGAELGKQVAGDHRGRRPRPRRADQRRRPRPAVADDAARGFLLDGYPRTRGQVGDLDAFLSPTAARHLDAVIELVVRAEESIERLTPRAAEQGRTDDTEEVIANRLAIYERETAPTVWPRTSSGRTAAIRTSSSSPVTRIPSARASTTRSSTDSRRRGRVSVRATCCRSTAAPSSTAGTATRPSRSSSADRTPRARRTSPHRRHRGRPLRRHRRARRSAVASTRSATRSRRASRPRRRDGREYGIIEEYVGHGIGRSMH